VSRRCATSPSGAPVASPHRCPPLLSPENHESPESRSVVHNYHLVHRVLAHVGVPWHETIAAGLGRRKRNSQNLPRDAVIGSAGGQRDAPTGTSRESCRVDRRQRQPSCAPADAPFHDPAVSASKRSGLPSRSSSMKLARLPLLRLGRVLSTSSRTDAPLEFLQSPAPLDDRLPCTGRHSRK
jgi:hypothetical protein